MAFRDMKKPIVLAALSALAQATRLDIHRLLVQAATAGEGATICDARSKRQRIAQAKSVRAA